MHVPLDDFVIVTVPELIENDNRSSPPRRYVVIELGLFTITPYIEASLYITSAKL